MRARPGHVVAAGAVLWRAPAGAGASPEPSAVQVAVVHRPKYDDWSLPKGKSTPGEHVLATAVREVREETGHDVVLGRPLGAQRYEAFGAPKTAHFWAGRAAGGPFAPNHEVDRLDWLRLPEAVERVTAERDRLILDRFAAGPLDTVPLVLLRHARAVARQGWRGPDAERPLDPAGQRQAELLAEVLAAYGPMQVVSSDSSRCVASVAPVAARWRTPVRREAGLTEEAFGSAPEAALGLLQRLQDTGVPTLVCSHRPVLPDLLAAAAAPAVTHAAPPPRLAPGAFWVLHLRRGQLVALETHAV